MSFWKCSLWNTTQSVLNHFTTLLKPTLRAYSICYLLSLSHIHALIWAFSLTSSSFRFLLSQMTIMMKPEEKKEKKNNTHDLCVFVWCCVFLFICFRVLHRFHWRKKYTMKLPSNRVSICEYINKPIQRYLIPLYINREHTM